MKKYKHLYEQQAKIRNSHDNHKMSILALGVLFLPLYLVVGVIYGVREFLLIWFHCTFWQDREL